MRAFGSVLAGAVGAWLAGGGLAGAQTTYLKSDNTLSLDQAGSWSPSGIPGPADGVSWNGTYANAAASIGSGLSVDRIVMGSPSQAVSVTAGSGALTIGSGGIDLSASTQNLTVGASVLLGANQTWTAGAGKTLTINGTVGESGGARTLAVSGNGTVSLAGNNTSVGPVIVNTGATLAIPSTGTVRGNVTVGISTAAATTNLSNSGTLAGTLVISSGTLNGTASPASPNANEFALIATGHAQLNGGSASGPVTNNGQLTLSGSAQIKSLGTISGSGGLGGINDNNTFPGGKVLVIAAGSSLSYFKPGNGSNATLQVAGNGSAAFSYFGYSSSANISYTTTFDGGTWAIGKLGRGNTGAQFAGTANLINGASVAVQSPGYEHGTWNIRFGSLTFNGTIAEGQGPTSHNIGLNVAVDGSGGGNGTLGAAGLTLGLGASNTAAENNSLTVGPGGTVSFLTGNLTVGTAFNHAAPESNTVALSGGKLVVGGTFQGASTVGANQTRTFQWTGGQLTAASIVCGAGFNGAGSAISASGLSQTAGVLAPGDTGRAGRTVVTGNYTLGANATLAVEIGGTTQASGFQTGQYDFLSVSGTAVLGGNLSFSVLPGFTPAANATFTIVSCTGNLTGAFANAPFGSRALSQDGLSTFIVSQVGKTVTLGQYLPVTPPVVSITSPSAAVQQGSAVTIQAGVSSLAPTTYQWRKNGVAIDGATGPALTIYSAQLSDSASYDVVVTNSAGSTTGSPFTLTVALPRSTQGIVVDAGSSRQFDATPMASSYAWQLDGATVGTNTSSFTYSPDVNAVGTHWLKVRETYSDGSSYSRQWAVRVRIPSPAPATAFYVSPTGSDSGDGTIGSPFLTLEKARDKIRTLARPLPAGGVTVYLRGGTYFRTSTFSLNATDSGTSGAPVVYRNYPGETVIISGGKPVQSGQFSALAASETSRVAPGVDVSRIWEVDLVSLGITRRGPFPNTFGEWTIYNPLGASSSGGICELFYNGRRMHLSRYPNHDLTDDTLTTSLKMNGVVSGTITVNGTQTTGYLNSAGNYTDSNGNVVPVGGAFQYNIADEAHIARWQTAMSKGGVWVAGYWRVPWQINGAKVGIIDTGTKKVIGLASGVNISNGIGYKYARPVGNKAEPYWVLNLLEELDQPGEWCIDFSRNKLYFLMDAAGAPAAGSVVLSDLGSALVQISGSYVNLQGITFEYGLGPGVQVLGGSRNLVAGCTFRNIGGYAVDLNNFSGGSFNGVVSCNMSDLASGGVLVRGGNNTLTPRVPTNNFVVNNRITDFARVVRVYAAAVDAGYQYGRPSVGARIAHNTASGSPHVGMLWRDYDHVFEYNDISDYCQFSDDMGGIYSFASNYVSNTVIRYNYLHHSDHGEGVYFDSDHINATTYGNVANLHTLASESRGYGFYDQVPGGTPAAGVPITDDSYNNIAVNCHFGFQYYTAQGGKIERNLAFGNTSQAFKWNLLGVSGGNYTYSTSNATVLGSGPNVAYSSNPGFIDFANDDLRLRPDSAAFTDMPGFEAPPLEMAGVYNDEFRSDAAVYTPFVTTDKASDLGSNVATLNGTLVYPQFEANANVYLYWGTTDGGSDAASWDHVEDLGTPGSGAVARTLTGLVPGTQYFFRFQAVNSAGTSWAEQSNSVTTYPATSVASGGSASADGASAPASNAFDGNAATSWLSAAGSTTGWIQYQFAGGAAYAVTSYTVTSSADSPARDPRDWRFLASDDGVAWTVLDTRTGEAFSARGQAKTYGFANPRPYRFYRLEITANNGDASGVQLAELQLSAPDLTPDTTGPVISTPGNLVVAAGSSSGAYVDYLVSAVDAVSGTAVAQVSPASGSLFAIGTTTVNVSATDAAGNTSTTSFTVTVTPPALVSPWTIRNIGTYNSLGTASLSSGTFTINATGGTSGITGDIWTGTNDNFTFISQPWTGDGIFTARIAGFTSTDASAKAGIMFRETSSVGSKYSFTYFLRKGDAWSQHKTVASGSSGSAFVTASSTGKGLPYWVRLVRKGNVFTSYISQNGTTWTQLGSAVTNALTGSSLSVGFAVGPRTATGTAVATFDNVTFLGVPAAPSGLAASPGVGQVALSWGAVATASSYAVKRSDASGGPYTTVASGLTSPSFTDAGATAGAAAYYVVTATNAAGEGAASGELSTGSYSAVEAWRLARFGSAAPSGQAADDADPDSDGLPNLAEYALGKNPTLPDSSAAIVEDVVADRLQITFDRVADPGITYLVESSSDMISGGWVEIWQSTGSDNTVGPVTVSDPNGVSLSSPPRRFLRLRVTTP